MKTSRALAIVLIFASSAVGQSTFTYEGIEPKDEKKFIKKADSGDTEAAYKLGFMYAFLYGHMNDAQAMKYLRLAAEKNDARAEWAIGSLYSQGRGVEKNKEKAFEWFLRAAEHGSAMGQVQACSAYSLGLGVEKDNLKAFELCRKAAAQGNVMGEFQLGQMYLRGEGTSVDEQEGQKWIAKAAAAGFGLAQEALARLKAGPTEPSPGAPKNEAVASVFITDNKKRDPVSQAELEHLLQGAKLAQDPAIAAALYQKALETGASPVAWYELARLYEQGKGVPKDETKAQELLIKAAKQEYVLALYRLGQKYRDGDGVTQDNLSAHTWFAVAANYGSEDGKAEQIGVARFLSPDQIARSRKAADDWIKEYPKIEPETAKAD